MRTDWIQVNDLEICLKKVPLSLSHFVSFPFILSHTKVILSNFLLDTHKKDSRLFYYHCDENFDENFEHENYLYFITIKSNQ